MFPPDDPHFRFEDDLRPPEPDTAVLQRVVARGRQRLFRRRALFGGIAAAVAAVLLSGGVAVAGYRSAGPGVAVQSPGDVVVDESTTTTTAPLSTPTTTSATTLPPQGPLPESTPTTSPGGQSCSACAVHFPSGTQPATPTDFVGEVKLSAAEVTAGDSVDVELDVTNFTDHYVDVEGALGGPATAVVCANDLTPDGHTNTPLHNDNPDANIFWIIDGAMASGSHAGIGPMTIDTTAAEVGVVTCEAVLVGTRHDGLAVTSYIIAPLSNIAAVTYTVLAAPDATTTTVNPSDTSTTVPETTVPPQ
jgi:hypothetical protein